MARLKFGAFLAPHHPIGEHPMLQFRRDLDLVEQLDALGYDEFWCGARKAPNLRRAMGFSPDFIVLGCCAPNYGLGRAKAIAENRRRSMVVAQT